MTDNISDTQLFNACPFAGLLVMIDSPRFTIIGVTEDFRRKHQMNESAILKKGFFEIFDNFNSMEPHPNRIELLTLFAAAIENRTPEKLGGFYGEFKKEGDVAVEGTYVDLEIIPIVNDNDVLVSLIVALKETENKTLLNASAKASDYYSKIIENSLIAFFLTKPDGTILEANKAACDLFGYSLEELRQIGRQGIIDHSGADIHQKIKERSETGKIRTELVGIRKTGEKFPIDVSSVIFTDANGEQRTSTSIIDITARKQIEQVLALSEKRYRTLFEDNPLPMIIWDFETLNIIDCNEEALIKYGYTREEFLQLSIRDIRPPEDIALIDAATLNEKVYGRIHKAIWRHKKKNGELMLMEITGHLMEYNNKKVSLVLLNDVTEREKNLQRLQESEATLNQRAQELADSNRELEQFAYVASHDLQEPLRMVTSFLAQLEKRYGDTIDDNGKQYIYYAVDGAKRMRQIILDLLEFSRIGRHKNPLEQVNINELVNDILLLFTNQIEESKATIELENLPVVKSFRVPLSQIFQNLIGNALKYRMKERLPTIKINCTEIPGYWQFSIRDNGIGINEQYFEKIFTIFQRLHNRADYTGTGIGLAIVKKIVIHLGGKIWVESEEGNGSVFHFTLPR